MEAQRVVTKYPPGFLRVETDVLKKNYQYLCGMMGGFSASMDDLRYKIPVNQKSKEKLVNTWRDFVGQLKDVARVLRAFRTKFFDETKIGVQIDRTKSKFRFEEDEPLKKMIQRIRWLLEFTVFTPQTWTTILNCHEVILDIISKALKDPFMVSLLGQIEESDDEEEEKKEPEVEKENENKGEGEVNVPVGEKEKIQETQDAPKAS